MKWTIFIILMVYFVGMFIIGVISNKKSKTVEDYYVAGRKTRRCTSRSRLYVKSCQRRRSSWLDRAGMELRILVYLRRMCGDYSNVYLLEVSLG